MNRIFAVLLSAVLAGGASAQDCATPPVVKTGSASEDIAQCGAAWDARLKCYRKSTKDLAGKPEIKCTRLDYRRYMYGCLGAASSDPARGTSACPIGQPDVKRS